MKQKGFISIGIVGAILVLLVLVGGTTLLFKSKGSNKVADNNAVTTCSPSLKSCGSGCIPQNSVCCDETNGNSYCLAPNTLCKTNPDSNGETNRFLCSEDGTQKSNDCSTGQVSCGMQCIKAGEKCCFGGACDVTDNNAGTNNTAKKQREEVKYAGEITMSASYDMDYNKGGGRIGHLSQQFSATIHFSDLVMSYYYGTDLTSEADPNGDFPITNVGTTKTTGTYTVSCSDPSRNESDSTTGEITFSSYPERGIDFVEMYDQTVWPVKHLGIQPLLSGYTETVEPYRPTWCGLAYPGDFFLHSIIFDNFWPGVSGNKNRENTYFGNTQRLASMTLKKIGYMSYDGETIPFSGTIVTEKDNDWNPVPGAPVIPYTGTFKAYRQ